MESVAVSVKHYSWRGVRTRRKPAEWSFNMYCFSSQVSSQLQLKLTLIYAVKISNISGLLQSCQHRVSGQSSASDRPRTEKQTQQEVEF